MAFGTNSIKTRGGDVEYVDRTGEGGKRIGHEISALYEREL